MKKNLMLIAALAAGMAVNAQYTQTLPLDYNDFFRAEAIATDGTHLERYEYKNTDQKSTSKPDGEELKADQWNRSGKTSDQSGANPVLAASTLQYSNYIDNLKGKEIQLLDLEGSSLVRTSIYSLKSNYDYSDAPYYLAAMVQVSAASGKGDILAMDGNFTANAQRARLYVNKQGDGYKLGLGWNGDPTKWTDELAFGSTHLVVIKLTPKQAGNVTGDLETASWWLDPDLSKTEAENTIFASIDGTSDVSGNKGIKSIRGITIRQRTKIAGKIAGLRFGANWADVVKADGGSTAIDALNVQNGKARKVMVDGQMLIERNGEYFNMTGAKMQ